MNEIYDFLCDIALLDVDGIPNNMQVTIDGYGNIIDTIKIETPESITYVFYFGDKIVMIEAEGEYMEFDNNQHFIDVISKARDEALENHEN